MAECVEAGAAGWIGKGAVLDEVDSTLRHVLTGGSMIGRTERASMLDELRLERASTVRAIATFERLTKREARLLGALLEGLGADKIAEAHFVALTTVRSQIRAVLQKLGVRSQTGRRRACQCSSRTAAIKCGLVMIGDAAILELAEAEPDPTAAGDLSALAAAEAMRDGAEVLHHRSATPSARISAIVESCIAALAGPHRRPGTIELCG